MISIDVRNLTEFKLMNNHALVKQLVDSTGDVTNTLKIVRNDANRQRETSEAIIVKICNNPFIISSSGKKSEVEGLDVGTRILYDTHSQFVNVNVEGDSNRYYVIRVPDIFAILEEE